MGASTSTGCAPAAFIGHGSPTNTLEDNRFTRSFPAADVPVVQLSINGTKDFAYHLDIGERLAPLRERGILIIGSGNIVHNLGRIDWARRDGAFDWAVRFDEAAREVMTSRPTDVLSLQQHPDFAHAAPTPDHFIPLLYLAGLAKHCERLPRGLEADPSDPVMSGCWGAACAIASVQNRRSGVQSTFFDSSLYRSRRF